MSVSNPDGTPIAKAVESAASSSSAEENLERRAFLKRAGGIAVAAPAVSLLLAVASKPAHATGKYPHNTLPWWDIKIWDRSRYWRWYLRRLR